ncbi:hypothetical protein V6N12_020200 [Hibiscus sabdariffa]|uniref:Uncharacterized protein n=1 Tax=Hibiscus sabdariffa TaxID=183260 RepID=A0ABR2BNE3_9ROSI
MLFWCIRYRYRRKRIGTCSSETSRCNYCIRRIGTAVGVQVRFAFRIGTAVGVSAYWYAKACSGTVARIGTPFGFWNFQ